MILNSFCLKILYKNYFIGDKMPEVDIAFDSTGFGAGESGFLRELANKAKNGVKLRENLLYALKNFAPFEGVFLINSSCRVKSANLPPSDMVFVTFVHISGHSYAGRFEKVAWSVAFTFKGVPFAFSLQKFGLRLFYQKNVSVPPEFCEEMLEELRKALPLVDLLFEPIVLEQIHHGNVTIANTFLQFSNMYSYFRSQAKAAFDSKPESKNLDLGESYALSFRGRAAGSYNANAMIDAFFSRLEHLLIILLPFANYNRKKHDLIKLMGDIWSEKFKTILNLKTDKEAKNLYDQLLLLREQYRNPVSHGNFQKNGKSLFFHMRPVGAISCHLSSSGKKEANTLLKINRTVYDEICSLFDRVDKFFENGQMKYGFRFACSGLDISFDEESLLAGC